MALDIAQYPMANQPIGNRRSDRLSPGVVWIEAPKPPLDIGLGPTTVILPHAARDLVPGRSVDHRG